MRPGRRKPALDAEGGINRLAKADKLRLMHRAAGILLQAPLQPRFLDRAHGHREDDLIGPFLNLIPDDEVQG